MVPPGAQPKRKVAQKPSRIPSLTALTWHVTLSIAFMVMAVSGMGWLSSKAIEAVGSEPAVHSVARAFVVVVLLVTLILGGKGIQAAGRIGTAATAQKGQMLRLTRRLFSWQGLLMVGAVVLGGAVEIHIALT